MATALKERCYGTHNWQARGRTNAIGALMGKLLVTVGLFQTNVNTDVFYVWVIKDLLPKLPPHSVVLMDWEYASTPQSFGITAAQRLLGARLALLARRLVWILIDRLQWWFFG
jgi:hypothetical protein